MVINAVDRIKIKEELSNIAIFSKLDGILEPPNKESIDWYIDNITFIDSLIEKIIHGEDAIFYKSTTDEYNELHLKIKENKAYVTDIWGNTLIRGMLIKDASISNTAQNIFEDPINIIISLSIYHNEEIVQAIPQETLEEYQSRWLLIMDVILATCFHRARREFFWTCDKETMNEIESIRNFKTPAPTEDAPKIKVFIKEKGKKKEIINYAKEKYEYHTSYEKILQEMMIEDKRCIVFNRPDEEIELTIHLCHNIILLCRKTRGYEANIMITVNATKQILVIENNNLDSVVKKAFGDSDTVMKEYDQIKRKAINIGIYYLLQYKGQRKKVVTINSVKEYYKNHIKKISELKEENYFLKKGNFLESQGTVRKLTNENNSLHKELEEKNKEIRKAARKITELELLEAEIERLKKQIRDSRRDEDKHEKDILKLQKKHDERVKKLNDVIVEKDNTIKKREYERDEYHKKYLDEADKSKNMENELREVIRNQSKEIEDLKRDLNQAIQTENVQKEIIEKQAIRELKILAKDYGICIVGGSESWQSRIEEMIPDIKILKNEHFEEFNLKYSSVLIINTAHTGHSITQKAKEAAKKYGCIIVHINGSNLQIMLDEINNAIKD